MGRRKTTLTKCASHAVIIQPIGVKDHKTVGTSSRLNSDGRTTVSATRTLVGRWSCSRTTVFPNAYRIRYCGVVGTTKTYVQPTVGGGVDREVFAPNGGNGIRTYRPCPCGRDRPGIGTGDVYGHRLELVGNPMLSALCPGRSGPGQQSKQGE